MLRRRRHAPPTATPNPAAGFFEVDNWTISDIVLRELVPVVGTRPFPLNELHLMVAAVARFAPATVFDWGTHVGASARVFHEAARALGLRTVIHSIDLPDDVRHVEHPGRSRGRLVRGIGDVHLHQGDGLETALRLLHLHDADPASTLFFLDGDHAYGSVLRELRGVATGAPAAAMLVHDTFCQSPEAGYNVGPSEAIATLLEEEPSRYRRIDTATGLPGMTLLYPVG